MVDDNVTIRLEAINDASPEVRRLISDVERLKKSLAGLKGAKFELVDPGMLRQLRSLSASSEQAAASFTRQARSTTSNLRTALRENRLRSQMRKATEREETAAERRRDRASDANLARLGAAYRFRTRQQAAELRERFAGIRMTSRLMAAAARTEAVELKQAAAAESAKTKASRRNLAEQLSGIRRTSELRRRHETEMAALRATNRADLLRSGRGMLTSGRRMVGALDTGPVVVGSAAVGAAIAAGIRSSARDAVSLDRAETAARMHMDQSVLAAPQLRQWALGRSAAFGIGADQLLSTTVEASKAGVPDEMAQAAAEMVVRLSKVFDMNLAETTQSIGYAIAQEFGAGRLQDISSVESLGNMAALLAGKTSANPAQMLSFLRTGLGAGANAGMSQESTMAFGAAAIQAGAQGQQASRALSSMLVDVNQLDTRRRAIIEKGGHRTAQDRLFMQIPQLLGYGSYNAISKSFTEKPDTAVFDLLKSFRNIDDPKKRNQAFTAIFGQEFGRFFQNMIASPAMLDRTLDLAKEAKRQSGDQLWVRQAFAQYSQGFEFLLDQSRSVWTSLKAEMGDSLKPFVTDVRDWLTGWQKSIGSGGLKARFDAVLHGLVRGFGFERFRDLLAAFGAPGQFDMAASLRAFEFAKGFAEGLRNVGRTVAAALKPLGSMLGFDGSSAAGIGKTIATVFGLSVALQALRPVTTIFRAVTSGLFGIGNAIKFLNSALLVAGFTSSARMGAGFVGLGSAVLGRLGISIGAGLLSTLGAGLLGGGLAIAGVAVTMGALAVAIMNWDEIGKWFRSIPVVGDFLDPTFKGARGKYREKLEEERKNGSPAQRTWDGIKNLFAPSAAHADELRRGMRRMSEQFSLMGAQVRLAALSGSGISGSSLAPAGANRALAFPGGTGGFVPTVPRGPDMMPFQRGNGPVNPFGYGRRGAIGGGFVPTPGGGVSPFSRGNGNDNFSRKAPQVMDRLMRDFGLTRVQAAAVLGNLGHESMGLQAINEKRPLIPGSRGGFGWAQWTGPRRRAFEAWAASNGLDPRSDEAQYGFLKHELQTTHRRALDNLKRQDTLQGATVQFERDYEGAGIKGYGSRLKYARRAMEMGPQQSVASSTPGSRVPDILAPTVPQGLSAPQDAAGITKDVPISPAGPGAGGRFNGVPGGMGAGGGGSGPVTIHINGNNSDPEALATLVQRRINECMNWVTHDMEYDV